MNNKKNMDLDVPVELKNEILKDKSDFLFNEVEEKTKYEKLYFDKVNEVDSLRKQNAYLNHQYAKMSNSKWMRLHPIRFVPKKVRNVCSTIRQQGLRGLIRVQRRVKFIRQHIKGKSVNIYDFLLPGTVVNQIRTKFDKDIKFSIIVPLYNTDELFLKEMIDSVLNQTYANWELCLADASDDNHIYVKETCEEYAKNDDRVKYQKLANNDGIAQNTNAAIDMSTGNYISLLDHDDILHPSALYENMKAICEQDADFIYTDEQTFLDDDIHNYITIHLKPDFAIDNLRANNYICHFTSFKKDLLKLTGKYDPLCDGSQDYDMMLKLSEHAEHIVHIPLIMYFWRSHAGSVASGIGAKPYCIKAGVKAINSHLDRVGLKGTVSIIPEIQTAYRIKYNIDENPLISIIIPNKDHIYSLHRCIMSLQKSTYTNYEVIIVENNSIEDSTFEYYDYLNKFDWINVIQYEGEFNYSRINNFATKHTSGSYYLFLNNDTEVIAENWIEEMLMYAQRADVGAVGAKLLYRDNSIQHAGVIIKGHILNMSAYSFKLWSNESLGYMGKLMYAQDVTAVTAACLLVSKEKFELVNGFDEKLSVTYNDTDLCLKLRDKNFLNVFTPYAELYHYESVSRCLDSLLDKKKTNRLGPEEKILNEKWEDTMKKGDPFYNPNFSDELSYIIDVKEYI